MKNKICEYFTEHTRVLEQMKCDLATSLESIAGVVVQQLKDGHKVLVMGNGGSAADAQHLAAELVGRFVTERRALPAIALTTDSSILTAVGNDYGFNDIFCRQVNALAQPGDVILGLSTSGNSENVLQGFLAAKECHCTTVGFLGGSGGRIADQVDYALTVPSKITAHIQEGHIVLIHLLCMLVDEAFVSDD